MISGILIISFVILLCTSMLLSFSFSPFSCSVSSCTLSSYNLLWNSPKTLAIPLRDVMTPPFSFFILVMSTLFADLTPGMFPTCEINKTKYQFVESQSTQVRQRFMKCDTQLLYGTSGPTVSEDGSCRASDSCALQGYVQMCMRSTLCSGDRLTRETNKVTKVTEDTKSGFYTVQSLMSLSHDDSHAITSRQKGNLRLTHLPMFTVNLEKPGTCNLNLCCRFRHVCRESAGNSKSRSP